MVNLTPPCFFIGNIPVYGRYILAPMDGYTDKPFRCLARKYGSAIGISEFINGIDVVHGHPHLEHKLAYSEIEIPFAYQIFDDDPERMLIAAKILRQRKPDFIDINMGCSAKNVSSRGAGAGLLKNPIKIGDLVENLVNSLDVPVTAKIRLGWDESTLNYMEVSRILQESGVSLISVHARTRKQGYSGSANWTAIGEIKSKALVPVIGNGDVKNLVDAEIMMKQTGCDGVMIGRAAIGNPWVFNGLHHDQIPVEELCAVIAEHLEGMVQLYGQRIGVLLFRKHLSRYLIKYLINSNIRREIFSIQDQESLLIYVHNLVFT
jgi:tRNA-dihydrouridine synthase B